MVVPSAVVPAIASPHGASPEASADARVDAHAGPHPALRDAHGRVLRKLRVSLTDACQYRCFYCMPEHPTFTPNADLLRPDEYRALCGALVDLGVEELRLTGGEPTVRPEFRAIVSALATLPAKRIGLTSNGQLLGRHLEFLRDSRVTHLNISLDSLDPGRFERITRGGDFRTVMKSVEDAVRLGFVVKVNAIVFGGVNDDELGDFARWSEASGVEVRFLEYMKIGDYAGNWSRFVAADAMIARLRETTELTPVEVPCDATAFVFETPAGGRIGFIASESKPFCGTCSRLRLSATGLLRSCLMSERGLPIRGLDPRDLPDVVRAVAAWKPTGRIDHVDQAMHAIGG